MAPRIVQGDFSKATAEARRSRLPEGGPEEVGQAMERHLAAILAADVVGFTRLVGGNGARTIDQVLTLWRDTLEPLVAARNGRLVSQAGDGFLVEFPTARDALDCALDWQAAAEAQAMSQDERLRFRIGVDLGDVYSAGSNIFGDGVNIAARLEQICPPDGICVSESVRAVAGGIAGLRFTDLGDRRLKNVIRPVHAWLVQRLADGQAESDKPAPTGPGEIRFCRSTDGVSLATCAVGDGPPLVFAGSWMTHLEKDWDSPWGPYLRALVQDFQLIRYDQRGNGMSDWDVPEISFERMVDDLASVIAASGHGRVALYGASQAASVAIAFTHRHPERVSRLVLHGGYARGRRRRDNPEDAAESEALVTLIRKGWGSQNPAFRQMMTSIFMPDASSEEAAWFNAFQRATAPPENAARFRELFDEMDVSALVPEIAAPTLVLHSTGDVAAPLAEGKFLASRIPGARLVTLQSNNHILFENEPEFPKLLSSLRAFLA